ncbi:hypothetical protein BT96DRAFT_882533 [Gymnopus androsaceus JB14]|uniref:Uncharacterized protein n=1 Tax=Gymnopus androsaceus JB14 TaxID=1447944 RepID=A0A6A4HNL3_9AGAR|nr:hypothetical protein BT96DRAFT_882533 [Gymnopus androsaceus JB14]
MQSAAPVTSPNNSAECEIRTNPVQNIVSGNKSDSAVYAHLLMTQKRGYPLWRPKDDDPRLPDIYKQTGVHIGDVGILDQFGGFDYLFNVCHPADHPLNEGRVPENFKLLEIDYTDIKESPQEFKPSSYVESKPSHISKTVLSGQPLPYRVPQEVGAGLSFSSSATSGALLILPEGGKRIDHQQLSMFYDYAVECAQSWYAHVNEPMARGVHNGALYLVTGFDKARAWGVASFIDANPGTVSLDFVPGALSNVGGHPTYWFSKHNCASASSDADNVFGNQSGCVFLRGFKIAVRHNPFTNIPKFCSSVKYISDLDVEELFPKPKMVSNFSTWYSISQQPNHTPWMPSNECSVLPNHVCLYLII